MDASIFGRRHQTLQLFMNAFCLRNFDDVYRLVYELYWAVELE